ncbi:MAG TPA: YqiA/YcfP family alpha/beta fold hydrolase [Vulgatibacter sp.]|nr:YqiA/YcfP family alpha/beta fold hydrolase [Vulgatibacter sp.]
MGRPGFVYLHGFASSPSSEKARFYREKLASFGVEPEVPDLNEGPGGFHGMTLSRCVKAAEAALERVDAGRRGAVIIGSSMGGLIAALIAARDPRIRAAVLLAPAFDLPARWTAWLGEEGIAAWRRDRELEVDHYGWGRKEKLGFGFYLDSMGLPPYPRPSCPTLILHGVRDAEVSIGTSMKLADGFPHIRLVELDTDHGMLDVKERLWSETEAFLRPLLREG